ncbi:MAG: Ig-like domain-containing protein [Nannocystaceae bacterium]
MTALAPTTSAAPTRPVIDNPYRVLPSGPAVIDLSPEAVAERRAQPPEPAPIPFSDLDKYVLDREPEGDPSWLRDRPALPDGWAQLGDEVVPQAVADGAEVRSAALGPDAARDLAVDLGEPQGALVDDICAYPDEVPTGVYEGSWLPSGEYPRRGTIYLNYVGGVLYGGKGENSAENYSVLAISGHQYPVFGGGEERAIAIAQSVQADFGAWAIRVVYLDRPHKTIPYVMAMVGGHYSDTTAGPAGGVAPSADCEDVGMRNICYSFTNTQAVNVQSNIIGQEIGHTYGLGHTYGGDRIMAYGYATNGPTDMIFGDDCKDIYIAPDQGGACTGVNKCHCGVGEQQNDKATISAIYAAPGPDMVEPTVEITTPSDGQVFPSGSGIDVEVDVWDDYGGYGWKLMIYQDGELLGEQYDYSRSRDFTLLGAPDGTYDLVAEIEDQADHIVQHRITVQVGVASGTDTDAGTGSGSESDSDSAATGAGTDGTGAGTDGSATGGSDSDAASDSATTGVGVDDDDAGCSCRSAGDDGRAPLLGLGALVLLGLSRRRA